MSHYATEMSCVMLLALRLSDPSQILPLSYSYTEANVLSKYIGALYENSPQYIGLTCINLPCEIKT